jgi:N-methylhydantoinase B/oxoprolinase/acetone carboxylase alpha subunit
MKHKNKKCRECGRKGAVKLAKGLCRICRTATRSGYQPRSSREQDKILRELKREEEEEIESNFQLYLEMLKSEQMKYG